MVTQPLGTSIYNDILNKNQIIIETNRGSQMAYLFRLPFSSGNNYLISFVRLMLGIDQATGSGSLSSRKITYKDSWVRTYGRLYQYLCSTTNEIPIGVYRTDPIPKSVQHESTDRKLMISKNDIETMIKTRLEYLNIDKTLDSNEEPEEFSYVIINPSYDFNLKNGDIIFLIKPANINEENERNNFFANLD
ncbi:potassium channel subfamily T member 2 isoform X7 [Brachionus plicatilis]|uniref:Potassium channel subfamily T member 2 isoform X7 n=1 Tax=Brachionus plicatilis TaxID=10195 RepID=A0A3M7Q402_BRAPC|nr:potassium channel subfamily T member 2 isoform X7 [Brachionus plicatilis]